MKRRFLSKAIYWDRLKPVLPGIAGVLLAALLLVTVARMHLFAAGDSSQVVSILRKAFTADRLVSYQGESQSRTNFRGRWVNSTARIFHQNPSCHRIEYTSKDQAGMVIVDDGHYLWRIEPRHKVLYRSDAPIRNDPRKLDALLANYRPELLRTETIAGRKAFVISLVPKEAGSPWKRIWVDTQTGVQLGSEDHDARGQIISESRFTRISFSGKMPSGAFEIPRAAGCRLVVLGRRTGSIPDLSKEVGFKVLVPGYLPKGYRLERIYTDKCGCNCGATVAHLRYGNGMNSISVLQCPSCAGMGDHCRTRNYGAASVVSVDRRKINVSLIGTLPSTELRKIAQSMK